MPYPGQPAPQQPQPQQQGGFQQPQQQGGFQQPQQQGGFQQPQQQGGFQQPQQQGGFQQPQQPQPQQGGFQQPQQQGGFQQLQQPQPQQGGFQQPQPQPQQQGGFQPQQQPQPQQGGNPYGGVESAHASTPRNPYLSEGDYVIEVISSTYNYGREHNAQIVEADIVLAGPRNPDTNLGYGTRVTVYFKHNTAFDSNIKELVIAASGFDQSGQPRPRDDFVSSEETNAMLNGPTPGITGRLLYVEARQARSREGREFTRYTFWPCASSGVDPSGRQVPDINSIPRGGVG